MAKTIFSLIIFLASLAEAAGPGDLATLQKGQVLAGAFSAQALYLDPSGAPKGARFLHERGLTVDVLFFDSVPQVSLYFRTAPGDDSGAPHTLEHLVLSKGEPGRKLNTMMQMRMGEHTAATASDLTYYQFSSAAGAEEFYELLDVFLGALVRPDMTDEEIRREVAHTAAIEEGGRLKLEEKGTVYTEMVGRTEQPAYVRWYQLARLAYGAQHPLSRNSGGEPEEIWKLTPASIRAFHAARYRLDANAALIAALPRNWDAADFLARLDAEIKRLEPSPLARAYSALPPLSPAKEPEILIGRYPSKDLSSPQYALMMWPSVRQLGADEAARAQLAATLLGGGETSYLYRDLVDQKTRKTGIAATGVGAGISVIPVSHASLGISGIPPVSITTSALQELRAAVQERVRWLHGLQPGSPELAEAAVRARALIRSSRRSALRSMQGPPMFGARDSDDNWHRALDALAAEPGFAKPLTDDEVFDRLLAELDSGKNPWAAALERAGMLGLPYVSAVLPDPELLEKQKAAKRERLAAASAGLAAAYQLPEDGALERFRAEADSATAVLQALAADTAKPSFLREPPLELDSLDWSEGRLPSGARLVNTRFQTPFTDISVALDLRSVPKKDWDLLPILEDAFGSVGVITAAGERLDYAGTTERVMSEIYGAGVGAEAYPRSGRAELVFSAYASSPEEVDKAVAWMENYLLRPDLSAASRQRLIDVLRAAIQSWRGIFQQDEAYWAHSAVSAYKYQDRPLYMQLSSPFTALRHLNRLRWRLEEPAPADLTAMKTMVREVIAASRKADRPAMAKLLEKGEGELGEYLRWELTYLPEDSWRGDMCRVAEDLLKDIGRSAETLSRLQRLVSRVRVRAGARVHINGDAANSERAAALVDALLARLPAGRPAAGPKRRDSVAARLRGRFPGLKRPAHVALVNNSAKTGYISVWTPAAGYRSTAREDLLDSLAVRTLSGAGPQSLFMRTWGAGLAYSNGLAYSASVEQLNYSAEKCPDPAQTLKFVSEIAAATEINDPFLLEYSLAGAFGDYRAGGSFSSRGAALAYDLEEGNRPELVRSYKAALLSLAREPGALEQLRGRFGQALGRILVGFPGGRVSAVPWAGAFLIGPEELIRKYEGFVREKGEADSVIRLYPRDFWP